jgi:flagellar protein FlaG
METNINSSMTLSSSVYLKQAIGRKSVAPAGSDQVSMSPRQTEALLPTDFIPVGQGAEQDVSGNQQEQSRLADDMRAMAEKANAYLSLADTHLEFKVNQQTGRVVISVVESDTQKVIRQIPPETLDRFANKITQMRGLLFEATG